MRQGFSSQPSESSSSNKHPLSLTESSSRGEAAAAAAAFPLERSPPRNNDSTGKQQQPVAAAASLVLQSILCCRPSRARLRSPVRGYGQSAASALPFGRPIGGRAERILACHWADGLRGARTQPRQPPPKCAHAKRQTDVHYFTHANTLRAGKRQGAATPWRFARARQRGKTTRAFLRLSCRWTMK